jgi:hypothetical protein
MFDFFRREPLYHYSLDRFGLKSPLLYRPEHRVLHVGGGPRHNHPSEINLNLFPMQGVDIVGDAHCLPFADATVDVVMANAVLEHVRDLETTVREIDRVLKPGGLIYIEIPFIQPYHTHDIYGTKFEDYRRLTRTGLIEALGFCQPLEVGVCVGPTSALLQILFSFLRDISPRRFYRRTVDRLYYFFGNLLVGIDGWISEAALRRSTIPSGVYYFGRKRDANSAWLEQSSQPTSAFPRDVSAEITLQRQTAHAIDFRVVNTSRTTWLRASQLSWGAVRVGLQRTCNGQFDRDFMRLDLPNDIAPEQSFAMSAPLELLGDADSITIDLVIEGICWFAEHKVRPLDISLRAK